MLVSYPSKSRLVEIPAATPLRSNLGCRRSTSIRSLAIAAALKRIGGPLLCLTGTLAIHAQIEFLPATTPQAVFAGVPSSIQVTLRNRGSDTAQSEFSTRLVQVSSTTVMPVSEPQLWKHVQALAGQTIVESVSVSLPAVRTTTLFRVEVLAGGKSVARYPVFACPQDLLKQLTTITGGKPVLIFDPERRLRPVLDKAGASCVDLEMSDHASSDEYPLAIFGPFASRDKMPAELSTRANELAKRNVAVVALLPPGTLGGLDQVGLSQIMFVSPGGTRPSILFSDGGANDLAGSASLQLALLRMAELSLGLRPPLWDVAGRQ
jgi:hypothetical protein